MNILLEGLRKIENNYEGSNSIANESKMFSDYYHKWKPSQSSKVELSYKIIPKFYVTPAEVDVYEDTLPSKLELEARTMFLRKMSDALLNDEELESLRALLNKHCSGNKVSEKKIGYNVLKEVISKASTKCRNYYSAKVFALLQESEFMNDVYIVGLFSYAMRKTWQKKTRIGLSVYDTIGKGYLMEKEMVSFVNDIIPDCSQLNCLEKTFYPLYVCTVVRKFMFFLDPMRTGRIRLKDILLSGFLDDLLVLRNEELPDESDSFNWFSAASALRVYDQYKTLDKNSNGMLSKKELASYGTATLTEIFIERVFQEFLTYDGEMDYKSYLEFVLALENKQECQALRYYFKVLDINHKMYLDAFSIKCFFRGIQEEMKKRNEDPISFEDIKDELFDMVQPADPMRITFHDLLNSQNAEYFVSLLTDLNEFCNYENREYT